MSRTTFTFTAFFASFAVVALAACGDDSRPRPDVGTDASIDSGMGDSSMGDSSTMDSTVGDSGAGDTGSGDATMDGGDATMDGGDATMDGGDAMMGDATMDGGDATMDAAMDSAMDAMMAACVDLDIGGATGDSVASGDLTGAGDDGEGTCGSTLGQDRAYTWTAPSTAEWTFDTFGSLGDTVLHIHTGAECTAAELDCNDDASFSSLQSRLDLMLTAGTMVTIVVDAFDDGSEDVFQLNITETSTIPADESGACGDGTDNDRDGDVDCDDSDCVTDAGCYETGSECSGGLDEDGDGDVDCADSDCDGYAACIETMCSGGADEDGDGDIDCADSDCLTDAACETCPAVDLMMTLGATMGTTVGETNNRSGSCGGSSAADRTHSFTAPANGTYTIDTRGSAFDTVLYVLGTGCDGLELGCDDDIGGGVTQSEVVVDLAMGQTVIIVVDGFSTREGAYTLNISNAVMTFGAPSAAGDLVITEIMQNPDTPDSSNEWFEILNTTASTLNLNGCTVRDLGSNSFTIGVDLVVSPGDYAVIATDPDPGFAPSYAWSGSTALGNSDDEIIIECGAAPTEIDRVEWDGGPMFPDPTGVSMSLSDSATDHLMNDTGSNWCETPIFFTPYDGVNLGTPGEANPDCP